MNDLIEKQAVLDLLESLCNKTCVIKDSLRDEYCKTCEIASVFDAIEDLPTVDMYPLPEEE